MAIDSTNHLSKPHMQKSAMFAAIALLSMSAWAASPSDTVNDFHGALGAGDKARVLALLSPAIVVYEAGHVERSRDEYASHHLAADMEYGKSTARKVLKHSERIDGTMATVMEETETIGSFKGKPVHSFGLETTLLEKQGEGWVIVHVHWSSRKPR